MTDELISRLMEDLGSEWQEEVQSAMHALASLGKAVVLPLLDAIEGRDPQLRRHAALVLEQIQPQEALPPLIDLLTEEEVYSESKGILVRILVDLMEDGSTDADILALLTQFSHDEESEIRRLAAVGLGKSNSVGGNVGLCRLAQDDAEDVRSEAQKQLTNRSKQKRQEGIQPLEPAMLEAAARLRVRNGLSHSRQEAITEMLTEGEEAHRELLPLLDDAGIKTLQEVTPLLKQIKDAKAHMPLIDIVVNRDKPWQLRQMALRSLIKLKQGEEFLQELFRSLMVDPTPALRIEALSALAESAAEDKMAVLSESLLDGDKDVRAQAALLLAERLGPSDKSRLRPLLEALQQFPEDDSRIYLLQGLAQVLIGEGGDQLFVPEIIDLLDPSDTAAFALVLDILDKIVPRQSSAMVSRSLLALLEAIAEPEHIEQLLALLVRALPRNSTEATSSLSPLLERFEHIPIQAFVLRLFGRIADKPSIESLIYHAEIDTETKPLQALARQLLADLEGTLYEVWQQEDGMYAYRPGLVCRCGEKLGWVMEQGREELRCTGCDEEYILLDPHQLVPIQEITAPLCFCPGCLRKHPLQFHAGELPRCPTSLEPYVVRSDTGQAQRVEALEFGLCECCVPPQPLDLRGDDILCIQSGQRPKDTQEHAALSPDTLETPTPTFSVSDTSEKIVRNPPPPPPTRGTGRPTRPSMPSPTTLTRIRSFQLRQALLTETETHSSPDLLAASDIEPEDN